MTELPHDPATLIDVEPDLNARLDKMEEEFRESTRSSERRLALAELKVEALRAGIIDLDGLKFVDTSNICLDGDGNIPGGVELIKGLKRAKPWLFTAPSSSSVAKVPPARSVQPKLATEMSDEEYVTARANIVGRLGI